MIHCPRCGFELRIPLAALPAADVGLYDDGRFPGRLIVAARPHFNHLDEMPADVLADFTRDVQTAARILRGLNDVVRVNVAVLGNREEHVHAHLIPRRPTDANFGLAPWDQAPDRVPLADGECRRLTALLAQAFRSRAAS
ncbi:MULTISPECIES: HIT family protein [Mycobacterium avium complex (MAC)]|uniref:Diadenosine tetraphosphatase n=1 Tax=Mycobacterium bouchedurhonense TaxID=701041 RepID=A0ABX3S5D8_MYCBC|nr:MULTISPECIES: HIT family protein [Mycobacterium avium complex (MAC)]ORA41831.1 diadenosine tetraphosphatase [Mycobacterium bouchedurhonense]